MKIFVTGGRGFLGRHLCRALSSAGHEVTAPTSAECDLTEPGCFSSYDGVMYDRIYHLACWTQAGDFCMHHPGEQWILNQKINTSTLSWWQARQPQARLIAIGSSCCYSPSLPHREDNFMKGDPIESLYTYAMTKRMLYQGMHALSSQFGLKYLLLVPSTLFGPDYHLSGRQMHFIFDLMRKIVDGKYHGRPVVLWGDGSQKRELVYVDDFVTAAIMLSDRVQNDIVNVGGGTEYSIAWFAGELCKLIGFDERLIKYDTEKYVGAKSKFLDVSKLRKLCPDFEPLSIHLGLERMVAWYLRALGLQRE